MSGSGTADDAVGGANGTLVNGGTFATTGTSGRLDFNSNTGQGGQAGGAYLDLPNPALFTALNRDTFELHCELVPFDAALAQRASDRAVEIVRASEARELLPRSAADRSSAICRGGWAGGEWHGACAWQDRCWRAAP